MKKKNKNSSASDKLAVGLCFGLIVGLLLNNLALGLAGGTLFGMFPGSKNKGDK